MHILGSIVIGLLFGFGLLWLTLWFFLFRNTHQDKQRIVEHEKLLRDFGYYMPLIVAFMENHQSAQDQHLQSILDNQPHLPEPTVGFNVKTSSNAVIDDDSFLPITTVLEGTKR